MCAYLYLYVFLGAWPTFDRVDKKLAFEPSSANRSPDGSLMAVGDSSGEVLLYSYPVLSREVCISCLLIGTLCLFVILSCFLGRNYKKTMSCQGNL